MKKVLIIITTGFAAFGGLTTVMMNYYREMDKSGLQIDFASTNEAPKELLNELYADNSAYYCLGDRKKGFITYLSNLHNLLKKERYDVIHVNGNSATMAFELSVAKKFGVPNRIAHVHSSKTSHKNLNKLLMSQFYKSYTNGIAVSAAAGNYLYKDRPYVVLNNAVNVNRYKFNEKVREKYRKQLKITDALVVGHVGKLYEPKNHDFLIDIFYELKNIREDARLLLVGGGQLEDKIKNKCKNLGIEKDVIFAGMQKEVSGFLQAMDVFVFPSLWEGLPLSLIEAQASGLKCLVSSNVTLDAKCSENAVYKDLSDGALEWANEIMHMVSGDSERSSGVEHVQESGFHITYEADKLRKIYLL